MDVSMPIASAIPSLDGPVYAALAATSAPLSLSQVHRGAQRGSVQGVRRVLLRMVRSGLVLAVPGGYVLNREHLAAAAVEQLASLWGVFADRVRALVDEWEVTVDLVGLFGSAARRDGDEGSDVDILVVSDAPDLQEHTEDLASAVSRWTGNVAQVVALSRADLRRLQRAKEPIVAAWRRELVVLYGTPAVLGGVAGVRKAVEA